MSTGNPLVHPFNVWSMNDAQEKNKHLAGAQDVASAIVLAGAVFIAAQDQSSQVPLLVVFDDADAAHAFIGDTQKMAS